MRDGNEEFDEALGDISDVGMAVLEDFNRKLRTDLFRENGRVDDNGEEYILLVDSDIPVNGRSLDELKEVKGRCDLDGVRTGV